MPRSIAMDPAVPILAALLILTLPGKWLLAAVLAAAVHELSHAGMILLLGGRIWAVGIGWSGMIMETEIQGTGKEFLAAAAGPAGSFVFLMLSKAYPEAAICGLVQGCFNLLPVYPLDGGRMLRCLLQWLAWPEKGIAWLEMALKWTVYIAAIPVCFRLFSPAGTMGLLLLGMGKVFLRKIPCKREKIRVQ